MADLPAGVPAGNGHLEEGEASSPPKPVSEANVKAAAPGVSSSVANASVPIGNAAMVQNGGTDAGTISTLNGGTQSVLKSSSNIDEMRAKGLIDDEGWLTLKLLGKSILLGAIGRATQGDVPLLKASASRPDSLPNTPNIPISAASNEVSAFDGQREPSLQMRSSSPLPGISPPSNAILPENSEVVDLSLKPQFIAFSSTPIPQSGDVSPIGSNQKVSFDDLAKKHSNPSPGAAPNTLNLPVVTGEKTDQGPPAFLSKEMQATLKLQDQMNDVAIKKAAAASKKATDDDTVISRSESIRVATQRAAAGLKRPAKITARGLSSVTSSDEGADSEMAVSIPVSDNANREYRNGSVKVAEMSEAWSEQDLLYGFIAGLLAAACSIYYFIRRKQKVVVSVVLPSPGEQFSIREGATAGQFILDIKDIQGNLLRTAGIVRPRSVTRASVLPPGLAVKLGADGSFDRFELTEENGFVRTEKEEGYQIFPFVPDQD
jgi:hypothetical protein